MVQRSRTFRVVGRRLPVVVKWAAPVSEVQDFHDDVCYQNVSGHELHDQVLREVLSQAPVENKEASLRAPLHRAHALLDQQYGFRAPCSLSDIFCSQM